MKKDLRNISKSEVEKILAKIEEVLSVKAPDFPILKGKFRGLRKFRLGNYRVIYTFSGNSILILKIGNRKDVYK